VVYALDTAEIGPMTTEASVAFVWNDKITLETGRDELEAVWRSSLSSPVSAAFRGEVDDIISLDEMRQKVVSALYMLADKGLKIEKRHTVLPL
ncbi:MAG: acyl-CoA carboxylase subunit beta, partial [Clostridia bacterium]|nr:acyl-CoA carboxylase subunit beta [Clostridia bacterium]